MNRIEFAMGFVFIAQMIAFAMLIMLLVFILMDTISK